MIPAADAPTRWFTAWVSVWTAIGAAIRGGYVLLVARHHPLAGDALYYHLLAKMLRRGLGWNDPFQYAYLQGLHPTAAHPPLFPAVLAASSYLGFDSQTGHRLFSCLIGTAAIPLIALVARRYGGTRAGVIAAALAAIYPHLWINDVGALSESLLAVMIALVLLVAESTTRSLTLRNAALLGGIIGLAALTRSEEVLLLPLLAWPLLARGTGSARERLARAGCATLVFAAVLAPWIGWNLSRFEHPVLISTNLGETLHNTSCDPVWYGPRIGWWIFVPPCPNDVTTPVRDESERDQRLRSGAWKYISTHESRYPIVAAARIGRIWGMFNPRQTRYLEQLEGSGQGATWIAFVLYYPLLLLGVVGLVTLHRRRTSLLPFIALIAVATITAAVFYGSSRFRVPADVGIVVLAGVALDALLGRGRTYAAERAASS